MNRKEFIKYAGIGAFALGIYPTLCCTGPRNRKELASPSLKASEDFDPDLEVDLTAVTDEIQIFPGDYLLFRLSTIIFFYGGWPFLTGLSDKIKNAQLLKRKMNN